MDVHGSGAAVVVVAPDLRENQFPRPHALWVHDEEPKQFVLHEGEVARVPGDRRLVRCGVELQVVMLEDWIGVLSALDLIEFSQSHGELGLFLGGENEVLEADFGCEVVSQGPIRNEVQRDVIFFA